MMTDEPALPPYAPAETTTSDNIRTASESVKKVALGVGAAFQESRKPGMPLSVLANIAREAPLGSLLVAFLLGVTLARRR